MEMAEGEGTTEENYDVDIATTASALGGSGVFHIINDIVGFVLYMHQQIPSCVISSSFSYLYASIYSYLMFDLVATYLFVCSSISRLISQISQSIVFDFLRLIGFVKRTEDCCL